MPSTTTTEPLGLRHPPPRSSSAVLALAEARGATGAQAAEAVVAGIQGMCLVGYANGPSAYARGFHTTGTIGAFGAAAGCARLLGLDAEATARALSLAATQAAGLKAVFGTMGKHLNAAGRPPTACWPRNWRPRASPPRRTSSRRRRVSRPPRAPPSTRPGGWKPAVTASSECCSSATPAVQTPTRRSKASAPSSPACSAQPGPGSQRAAACRLRPTRRMRHPGAT